MNTCQKKVPSEKAQVQLATLQDAVTQVLEKKKRLGQYAVIWANGKAVLIGDDAPAGR